MMLSGAIAAATRVPLSMNVRRDGVDGGLCLLPALATPTVSTLADPDWVDLSAVVGEGGVRYHRVADPQDRRIAVPAGAPGRSRFPGTGAVLRKATTFTVPRSGRASAAPS